MGRSSDFQNTSKELRQAAAERKEFEIYGNNTIGDRTGVTDGQRVVPQVWTLHRGHVNTPAQTIKRTL